MDISLTNMLKGARQYFQGIPTVSNANLINSFNNEPSIYSNNEKYNLLQLDSRKSHMDVNYQNHHHQQTIPVVTTASSTSSSYWSSTDSNSNAIHQQQHQHHHQPQPQYQSQYHQSALPNHHSYTSSSSNSLYNFQKITYADSIAATPVTVPHPKHNSPVTYHELQSIKPYLQHQHQQQQQQQLPQTQSQQQFNHYASYPNTNTSKIFYSQDFSGQQFPYNQHQRDFTTQSILEKSCSNVTNTTELLNSQQNYTNVPNVRSQSATNQREHYYQQQQLHQSPLRQERQLQPGNHQQQSENFPLRNSYQNIYTENRDYLPSIQSPSSVPMNYFTQNHPNNIRLPENYNQNRKSEQHSLEETQSERREKTQSENGGKSIHLGSATSQQIQFKPQEHSESIVLKTDFNQKLNKRESPLDLSVKTIRTSADSTASVDDGENYNNSTFNTLENSRNSSILSFDTLNTYPPSSINAIKSQNDNMKAPFNKYQQLFQQQQQQRSFHSSSNSKNANVDEWLQNQQEQHQHSLRQHCFQTPPPPSSSSVLPFQQHINISTVPKKRPLDNVTSSNSKIPKIENWLQAIDQQIEQKFSSYTKKKGSFFNY